MYSDYIDYSMAVSKLHTAFPDKKFAGAIITGSGGPNLRKYKVSESEEIEYSRLHPKLELSVPGHEGKIYLIQKEREYFLVFQGRIHYYECADIHKVAAIAHLLARAEIPRVIITNAAGSLVPEKFKVGDIVAIADIDSDPHLEPFCPWDGNYIVPKITIPPNLQIERANYYAVTGPSFESGMKARRLRNGGADVVGMSTTPEVLVLSRYGMQVSCLSLITNVIDMANNHEVTHDENISVAKQNSERFARLVFNIL